MLTILCAVGAPLACSLCRRDCAVTRRGTKLLVLDPGFGYNDVTELYCLDLNSMAWTNVALQGEPPLERLAVGLAALGPASRRDSASSPVSVWLPCTCVSYRNARIRVDIASTVLKLTRRRLAFHSGPDPVGGLIGAGGLPGWLWRHFGRRGPAGRPGGGWTRQHWPGNSKRSAQCLAMHRCCRLERQHTAGCEPSAGQRYWSRERRFTPTRITCVQLGCRCIDRGRRIPSIAASYTHGRLHQYSPSINLSAK
jgi:hypothetical protein